MQTRPIQHSIDDLLPKAKAYLAARDDIAFAYLFGSRAAGKANRLSDIDIAVYLASALGPSGHLKLLGDLIDIFHTDEIDLVVLNSAPIGLKMRVLKQRRLLADNQPYVRHRFESLTMRSYFDFAKFESRILEERFYRGRSNPGTAQDS